MKQLHGVDLMINTHLFLLRNRTRKKWKVYQQFFQLVFDFTSLVYALLVIGYFAVAIILEGNVALVFKQSMLQLEAFTIDRFWHIVTILPLFYLLRAFQQPGITFSTAEYVLTILPNKPAHVWLLAAINRWLKAFVMFLLAGTVLFLFSPTSMLLITTYICLLFFMNVSLTIPEWKFFQLHILAKIAVILGLVMVNISFFFTELKIIGIGFIILLIVYNIVSIPNLFRKIDWKKVTAASDFKLWNMMIISQATKIKFKKERQYSIWQRLSFWKKPFPFRKHVIYHRLWHLYIEKNLTLLLQVSGALLLMLFVFLFMKKSLFLFAFALTIHIFTSFMTSMFHGRLGTDIVAALPWDLPVFKETLLKWAFSISFVFLVPFFVYAIFDFSYWIIPQMVVILFIFYFILHAKFTNAFKTYDKNSVSGSGIELGSYGLLILLIFSNLYPFLLIVSLFIIGCIVIYLHGVTKTPTSTGGR